MAYLKPNWFERNIFKHLAMKSGLMGTNTLLVPGRTSGRQQRVPVIPVEHEGARYLVSTRGESNWVHNLRAAGRAELKRGSKSESVRVTEVPVAERPPVLAAYRKVAGREVERYFKRLPDPSDHPVFRLDPA